MKYPTSVTSPVALGKLYDYLIPMRVAFSLKILLLFGLNRQIPLSTQYFHIIQCLFYTLGSFFSPKLWGPKIFFMAYGWTN